MGCASAEWRAEVDKNGNKNKAKKSLLEYEKAQKRNLEIMQGTTSNGNKFEVDTIGQTVNEYTIAPSYLIRLNKAREEQNSLSEFSSKKVCSGIVVDYDISAYRLGRCNMEEQKNSTKDTKKK